MIGKYARGLRHLRNNVGVTEPTKVLLIGGRIEVCHAALIKTKCDGEQLIIFQNRTGDRDINRRLIDEHGIASKMMSMYNYYVIAYDNPTLQHFGRRILILPNDIDEQINNFISSNKKLLQGTITKYAGLTHPYTYYIYCNCNNSPNLFAWAITQVFKNGVAIHTMNSILNWYELHGSLSNKLLNGTITAYNSKSKVDSLTNELNLIRRNKRANLVINSFNTSQKKLLKELELTEDVLLTFSRFNNLSTTKKINFIRKMSTIDDVNEIINQMKTLVKIQYEWNKESFMKFLTNNEDFKYNIIHDKDNIVLLLVNDFETIKHIAKTTNWCISKNMQYWKNYMTSSLNKQYVMYNFGLKEDDEYSIVGFTVSDNNRITHAHSFTNISLMNGINSPIYHNINCIIDTNNIQTLLVNNGIPMNGIYDFSNKNYEWNKESFIKFLDYAVTSDNYDIISDNNDKMVFFVKHPNVRFIIGKQYSHYFDENISGKSKHILFCDFSKDVNDSARIKFGLIARNNLTNEEECENIYDLSCCKISDTLNKLIIEYNLPYDIICRVYNEDKIILNKLFSYNLNDLKEVLSNKEKILELFKKDDVTNKFIGILNLSLNTYNTFDIINAFIDKGYKFSELLTFYNASTIVKNALYNIGNYGHRGIKEPTEELYNKLINKTLKDRNSHLYFSYFFAKKIIENETDNEFFEDLGETFCDYKNYNIYNKYICDLIFDKINFTTLTDSNRDLLYFVTVNAIEDKLEKLLKINFDDRVKKYILERLPKDNKFFRLFQEKTFQDMEYDTKTEVFIFEDEEKVNEETSSEDIIAFPL